MKLKEINQIINGKLFGNEEIVIENIVSIEKAKQGDISFIAEEKFFPLLEITNASCVIVSKIPQNPRCAFIQVEYPYIAFKKLADIFYPFDKPFQEIHSSVIYGKNCKFGKNISIAPFVFIADEVILEDNVVIFPHTYIGSKSKIGEKTIIHSNVSIREKCIIGKNVIIHNGTCIGSDGFGYTNINKSYFKIPQIGKIIIEDNVEIGSNVSIDRATLDSTIIGKGTKIDNLVQIGHNVKIGENCIIAGMVGIAGSVKIGNNVILGGQAGISDHVEIGDNVIAGSRSGIIKNIPANTVVSGFPAREHRKVLKEKAYLNKLPNLIKRISEIENKIK
ncbi:MAG: UDP-3-O-(3-hydroxymyristoyl)glucosamine N-acyltransferase [bacterium]